MRGGFGCNENPIISSTFAAAGFETKSCDVQERLLFDNDGMPAPFVERRALDASGVEIPHDGQAIGELVYRSPTPLMGIITTTRPRLEHFVMDGIFLGTWLRWRQMAA